MPGNLRVTLPEATPTAWRALALGLSALTLALNGYATFARHTQPAPTAQGRTERASTPEIVPSTEADSTIEVPIVRVYAEDGSPAALDALIGLAAKNDSFAALGAIARIGGDRARQYLSERLTTADESELPTVASALATLGDPPARETLRNATRASRGSLRLAALDALRTLDTPDVREFMLGALNEPEPAMATAYFSDVREPRALPLLERLARVGSPEVSRAALDALSAQGASAEGTILRLLRDDTGLSDALLESPPRLLSAQRAVRNAGIARLRDGTLASGPIFDFMEQDLAASTREALVLAAHDPTSTDSALAALVQRGDSASLLALSQLASDSDPEVAVRAGCTLVSRPDSRSRLLLQRATQSSLRKHVANALVYINAPGARPI